MFAESPRGMTGDPATAAGAAMAASSITVVTNANRLRRFAPGRRKGSKS